MKRKVKKSYAKNLILLYICSFMGFCCVLASLLLLELDILRPKVGTTEFEVTVVEVYEKDDEYALAFENNKCILLIDKDTIINLDVLTNLTQGDKVFFKLTELLEGVGANTISGELEVATIRTETQVIVSEDSFYREDEKQREGASEKTLGMSCVFFAVVLYNFFEVQRKRKQLFEKKTEKSIDECKN